MSLSTPIRRPSSVRLRRFFAALGTSALVLGLGATVPFSARSAPRNNYYAYTDDAGVLHVTNVPEKRRGAWKLWKSLEGSGSKSSSGKGGPAVGGKRGSVRLGSERLHRYDSHIRGAAARYQLPESLVRAVIHTESNYHARVPCPGRGRPGLMQLMPKTAKALGVDDAFDPRQNIYGGTRGTFVCSPIATRASSSSCSRPTTRERATSTSTDGVPPFAETRAYVSGVLKRYYAYERQAQLGRGDLRRGPARHIAP